MASHRNIIEPDRRKAKRNKHLFFCLCRILFIYLYESYTVSYQITYMSIKFIYLIYKYYRDIIVFLLSIFSFVVLGWKLSSRRVTRLAHSLHARIAYALLQLKFIFVHPLLYDWNIFVYTKVKTLWELLTRQAPTISIWRSSMGFLVAAVISSHKSCSTFFTSKSRVGRIAS